MNKEAINLLTKDVAFWDNDGGKIAQIPREDYDQALAILTEQPPAGDFTKELREAYDPEGVPIAYEAAIIDINDLCTRLDRSEAEIKKYVEMDKYKSKQIILGTENYNRICKRVERLKASREDLLTAYRQAFNKSHNPEVEKILEAAIKSNKGD